MLGFGINGEEHKIGDPWNFSTHIKKWEPNPTHKNTKFHKNMKWSCLCLQLSKYDALEKWYIHDITM